MSSELRQRLSTAHVPNKGRPICGSRDDPMASRIEFRVAHQLLMLQGSTMACSVRAFQTRAVRSSKPSRSARRPD